MVDRIEKLAQYVAQSNGAMEDTVRERQRTNPLFAFLFGGEGAGYYQECLRKYSVANNPPMPQVPPQGASIGGYNAGAGGSNGCAAPHGGYGGSAPSCGGYVGGAPSCNGPGGGGSGPDSYRRTEYWNRRRLREWNGRRWGANGGMGGGMGGGMEAAEAAWEAASEAASEAADTTVYRVERRD